MNSEQKQVGWIFLVWWTGLTIVGGLSGDYIVDTLGLGTQGLNTAAGVLLSMLGSGVFALSISSAQWILLRRYVSKSGWWLIAGTVGRAFGVLIGFIAVMMIIVQFDLNGGTWSFLAYVIIRGAVLGVSQWIILRQWRTKTGWWILGNAISWMLVPMVADFFVGTTISNPIVGILLYAIPGIITGALIMWILRQPIPEPNKNGKTSGSIRSLILIWALSWGISWFVGWYTVWAIGWGYSFVVGGEIGGRMAGGIAGLIGGIGTAIILRKAIASNKLKIYQSVILALGWAGIVFYDWADGFVVASLPGNEIQQGVGGPMSGLVGGVLTALILSWANRAINWKQLVVTIGGWALGFTVGGLTTWNIGRGIALDYATPGNYSGDLSSLLLLVLISSICGAFAGWLGGTATSIQILTLPSQDSNNSVISNEN